MKALRERIRDGEILFGGTVTEHFRPSVVKAFAGAGFDFLFIENEHASINPAQLADFVLASRDNGLEVVTKLGDLNRADTARLLEMGVMGIQLPRTESPDDMTTLLDYMKFPPVGSRASATGYGNSLYAKVDKAVWYEKTNNETFPVCHIETRRGVEHIGEIAKVDGIDVCFVGPSDLSLSYGKPGQYKDPDFLATVQHVLDTCEAQDIVRGIVGSDYDSTRYWIDRGVTFFECASDLDLLRSGATQALEPLQRARDKA